MRNLVVCCDGTWNTPDQSREGVPTPTNVYKLFAACEEDATQLKYYHPGVGTEGGPLKRMIDGGIGRGLDRNIKSGYKWLCAQYERGDRIFLFGFSRGAYTVRSLSGFILKCGLLDLGGLSSEAIWKRVDTAYDRGYRHKQDKAVWGKDWPRLLDQDGKPPEVHFVGVWDTVGARGVPDDMVLLDVLLDDPDRYRFHNTNLDDRVRHAYHAVALDELRASFAPTLWRVTDPPRPPGTSFEQVWLAGNHGDIGGGHPDCGLSDIAMQWMADHAKAQGLRLKDALIGQLRPDSQAVLHNNIAGIWSMLRTLPRAAPLMSEERIGIDLHPSAWERHQVPPIRQSPYRRTKCLAPGEAWSRDIFARDRWNDTGVWLDAKAKYRFEASGEWLDKNNAFTADGEKDGGFGLGHLVYRGADLIAGLEKLYRKRSKKKEADFWGTRRYEEAPWFALTGMVANQADVDGGGTPPSGECFTIGSRREDFSPQRSGYLYCFANDAWRFYENNRGSVYLTITRLPA
ncbi:DUF2235 domain-containing protein [Thiorhodococcus minor]|uniref:DUF2235 domain-containing protein n=1 Tax=Thiorhodococcus minor TaxID=57489 RepID=A0A6M0K792_9GAMM|nr:DUF2235 domain-containing protein [Thiorhodococcus minor]NEV64487.1 DUF2235 domain-containing protein [Thiorhodococcus minor]